MVGRKIYDSYNAKFMRNEDVAVTFVSNDEFFSVCENTHCVILGPRGCGKTTMFKMLTTSAQKSWSPQIQKEIDLKENLPFVSIYIPSDELWKAQLEGLNNAISSESNIVGLITKTLITTNILSNFCTSIYEHIRLTYGIDEQKESDFSKSLLSAWRLDKSALNILSIRTSLEKRKSFVVEKVEKFILEPKSFNIEEFFFIDFLEALKISFMEFERIYNNGKELKWALCFDELELVSKDFYNELVSKLRISPQNILFKLSVGPLADFSITKGQLDHDFKVIKMWPFNSSQDNRFMAFVNDVAVKRLNQHVGQKGFVKDLKSIFGELDYTKFALEKYSFAVVKKGDREEGTLTDLVFKKLAELDVDFRHFLEINKIDSEHPFPLSSNKYDTITRKIKEIVINRLVFISHKNENKNGRKNKSNLSLKIFPIYYGYETILKICEGNPRYVIGLMNELIPLVDLVKVGSKVDYKDQCRLIHDFSKRFYSMIRNFPIPHSQNIQSIKSVETLDSFIEKIGSFFQNQINEVEPFKVNPFNSFNFNKEDITPEIQNILDVCVEIGAIIKIDPDENYLDPNNKESKFRLSYVLYPKYKMPLRLYSTCKLKVILNRKKSDSDFQTEMSL